MVRIIKIIVMSFFIYANAYASLRFPLLRFSWQDVLTNLVYNFNFDSTTVKETVNSTTLTATTTDGVVHAGPRAGALFIKNLTGLTFSATTTMTFCGWLNIPAASYQSMAYYYGFGIRDGGAGYNGQTWYRVGPLGYHSGVAQVSDDTTTSSHYANYVVLDGLWHHYCTTITTTGAKAANVYKDGLLVDTVTGVQRWASGNTLNLLDSTVFSSDNQVPLIADWKVYSRVLSPAEILALAQK